MKYTSLQPHTSPIEHISFSTKTLNHFLTATATEIKIFDKAMKLKHKMDFYEKSFKIINSEFIPTFDKIISCFSDDSISVWSSINFKLIKNILPFRIVGKWMKKNSIEYMELTEDGKLDEKTVKDGISINYSNGRISTISLSENGRFLAIGSIDNILMIFSTTLWEIVKLVKVTDVLLKEIKFCRIYGKETKIINVLSKSGNVYLINLDENRGKTEIYKNSGWKIINSKNGKMLAIILNSGEILINNNEIHLQQIKFYQSNLSSLKLNKHSDLSALDQLFNEVCFHCILNMSKE